MNQITLQSGTVIKNKDNAQEVYSALFSVGSVTTPQTEYDAKLASINQQLETEVCNADKEDYAIAIASGILAGIIDSVYVGETKIDKTGIALSKELIDKKVGNYAVKKGCKDVTLKGQIKFLEKLFPVPQDNSWSGEGIKISTQNHHLADLAHHPTPLGLVASIVSQFLRVGIFVNRDGEWHFIFTDEDKEILIRHLAGAAFVGILNWLVSMGFDCIEDATEMKVPKCIKTLAHVYASSPALLQIAKYADNWYGHLLSDIDGSSATAGAGMGIPGVFISLLYELSSLPILNQSGLPEYVNNLYQKQRVDFRQESAAYRALGKQAIPVMINEICTRSFAFFAHLAIELKEHKGFHGIHWEKVVPFGNKTIDRMITISSMTFTIADTADAAVHAALESSGNWVIFSGKFVTRFNYVGAGRAMLAVKKEFTSERKEAELLHEKRILTEAQSTFAVEQLEAYMQQLEERVTSYLVEDIQTFMSGFDLINQGIMQNDSDLVIRGNVEIQQKLGKEAQFTSQEEFDELMDSNLDFNF